MTGIIAFLWICLLVALASAKVTLQGRVSRAYFQNSQDPVFFNGILFLGISVSIALFFPVVLPDTSMLLWALAVSGFTFTFQTCYALAIASGPVSLTVLITTFSQFINIASGMIMYNEKIYLTQLVGVVFMLLSMFLNLKIDKNQKNVSVKWIVLSLTAMLACAVANILQKHYGKLNVGVDGADTTFLSLIYLSASILAFLFYALRRSTGNHPKATMKIGKTVLLYALAIAVMLAVYQKCYMVALVEIDSAVLFPSQNGMQSLVMTFVGVLFFKDRLSLRQWLGIACGILCVLLMNLSFGPAF